MLQYDRIDISEGIDTKKTNASKKCKIFHYWYFKDISSEYEPHLWNGCHGLMQKAVSFNNIAIVYIKGMFTEFTFGIWVKMMQLT